jgi:hypothetical protein
MTIPKGLYRPSDIATGLPLYFATSATERFDVAMFAATSDSQEDLRRMADAIRVVFQKLVSNPFNQVLLVHDLLVSSMDPAALGSARKAAVAMELFVKLPLEYARDYHLYISGVPKLMNLFIAALVSNASFHECVEEQSPGTSGLTPVELKFQSHIARNMRLFYKSTS